jgi:hypothetical protein
VEPGAARRAADGLADAAAAYRKAGLGADEAERRAVADFGTVEVVGPELRREIGVRQARRTSRILCAVLPVVLLVRSTAPGHAPHGRAVLLAHLGGLAALTVLLGVAALACAGRLAVPSARLPSLVGYAAMAGGAAVLVASAALPGPPALAATTALAAGAVTWSGALCRRTA